MTSSGSFRDISTSLEMRTKLCQIGVVFIMKWHQRMNKGYIQSTTYRPSMEVIQELLSQIKIKAEQLGLKSADVDFDHAISAKALEVLTNPVNEELQSFINLRMGGFHACCIFISVIGKRFGAGGLKDIIVGADLTGTGSVEATLKGKHYNPAMRILKTVFESLQRLKLDAFESWLLTTEFLNSNDFRNLIEKRNAANMANAEEKSTALFSLWEEFTEFIQTGSIGPMAVFWQSFLDMTETLLDYFKSFCTVHWELHLQAMEGMLKWFHVYENTNYARHFTYCWATQQKLAQKHPEIYLEFCKGNFSVRRSQGKFDKLPPDQVIEQTINKEQKGHGGIIGYSTSAGTVQRWIVIIHVIASIATRLKEQLGIEKPTSVPKHLSKTRKRSDEQAVASCYELVSSWNSPFEESTQGNLRSPSQCFPHWK